MEKFNVDLIKAMMKDLQEAVKSVEEKHGVAICFGSGTFYNTKLELPACSIMIKTDPSLTVNELLYAEHLKYVFPNYSDLIGKEFRCVGIKYKLLGLKTKRSNSKFMARNLENNKLYSFDKSIIDEKFS